MFRFATLNVGPPETVADGMIVVNADPVPLIPDTGELAPTVRELLAVPDTLDMSVNYSGSL